MSEDESTTDAGSVDVALSDETLAFGAELTDALLGVDQLYRAEVDGETAGLAVLDMSAGRTPEPLTDYGDAQERFAALESAAASLPEPDRRLYYQQTCASTQAFVEWRRDGLSFTDQIARFLHVDPAPPEEADIDEMRARLHEQFTVSGYDGDLEQQCADWQEATAVPSEDAPAVLTELLAGMRTTTLDTLDLPSATIPSVRAEGVSEAAFNAMCDYANRRIVINTDPVLTRPWLKKLAVHEGYPGHVLQFALREQLYEDGVAPADGLLSVVNTASSSPFEGIADSGLRLLEAYDGDDRIASLIGRYQAALGTAAAWRFHEREWTDEEVRTWLDERTLIGGRGWVDNRVRFISAPDRAVLMWSYWHGEPVVSDAIDAAPASRSGAFVKYLYGRLHSVETVGMFPGE